MLNTLNLNTRKRPEMGGIKLCNQYLNGKLFVPVKYGGNQTSEMPGNGYNFKRYTFCARKLAFQR